MSSLAIPPPCSSAQAPLDPKAHWITPEEQLYRFALPMAEELVNESRGKLPIFPNNFLEQSIIECAAQYILRRSDIFGDYSLA